MLAAANAAVSTAPSGPAIRAAGGDVGQHHAVVW
jgi:hypothetical protein